MDQNDLMSDLEIEDLNDIQLTEYETTLDVNDEERVAARRRRRNRQNQQTAILCVLALLVVIVVGTLIAVPLIWANKKQTVADQNVQQQKVDELLASEGEIVLVEDGEGTEGGEQAVVSTREQKLAEIVNAGIEVMPLEDKVAGLFIVTPEALTGVSTAIRAGDGTREALSQYAVGGVIYFTKNIQCYCYYYRQYP